MDEFGAPRPIEDYIFLPEQDAVDPHHYGDDLYRPIVNCWWLTHRDNGLAFWNPPHSFDRLVRRIQGLGAPQCNTDKRIAEILLNDGIYWPHEIRFFKRVWVPVAWGDVNNDG